MKKWYQSKTVWVNVLPIVAAIILLATKEFTLPEVWVNVLMFLWGAVNIVLRSITKESIQL